MPGYGRDPKNGLLDQMLGKLLDRIPVTQARPGDILAFAWREHSRHLAMMTPKGIIHALARNPNCVVEHSLSGPWKTRIKAAYRFRGLA